MLSTDALQRAAVAMPGSRQQHCSGGVHRAAWPHCSSALLSRRPIGLQLVQRRLLSSHFRLRPPARPAAEQQDSAAKPSSSSLEDDLGAHAEHQADQQAGSGAGTSSSDSNNVESKDGSSQEQQQAGTVGQPAADGPAAGTAATADGGAGVAGHGESEYPIDRLRNALWELFRLLVVLPLRLLVLSPLAFILRKMKLLAPKKDDLLRRIWLDSRLRRDPTKLAAELRALNEQEPEAVIDFFEAECMGKYRGVDYNSKLGALKARIAASKAGASASSSRSSSPGSSKATAGSKASSSSAGKEGSGSSGASEATLLAALLADLEPVVVNAAVVREYLAALVKTGRLAQYGDEHDASTPLAEGQSHRSLARLLSELRTAAGGGPVELAPGSTLARPLHVVMQGQREAGGGLAAALQSFLGFCITLSLFTFIWGVGAHVVRRHAGMPGSPVGGTTAAVPSVSAAQSQGMFAAKEYSKENLPERSVKTFSDVKGCDEAVEELQEIVAYLKNPDKFTRLGGRLPKGVLLTGPPGTGKTLLARAVAGEAGVPFFYKAGSEFDEMFVGVGSRRVRNLFAQAKKKAPCIIFIDEIDAVGGKRNNWESSGGSRKTLNQLLTDMDGFEENSGVVVMAATNLPELLDSALTRPGRFDRQVAVPLPDVKGRQEILDLYLAGKPVSPNVDSELLARRTPGFSGAQLYNLVNEAALLAARHDRDAISAQLLDEARDKILMGAPRTLTQTAEARRLTAYHEGGHALVALYTPGANPIHKATIVPRGHALGMVSQVPDKDEYSTTKQQMLAHIDVCMGGKAAEELIFGEDFVTSGATSDLQQATRMARHMVEDCGMSARIGPVAVTRDEKPGSDVRKAVDEEVALLLKSAYGRVETLLRTRERELHALASALLEKETLTQAEIRQIVAAVDAPAGSAASAVLAAVEEAPSPTAELNLAPRLPEPADMGSSKQAQRAGQSAAAASSRASPSGRTQTP